ncbi:MAG: transglutaminase family protein [Elusimicrobiales bacterium]
MIKTLPDNELKALIILAGDEEDSNSALLRGKLAQIAGREPERLEAIAEAEFSGGLPPAVASLLEEARWALLENLFSKIAASPSPDLEEGLFLISKFAYPRLSLADISAPADALAADIKKTASSAGSLEEYIAAFNETVFRNRSFSCCDGAGAGPESAYLYTLLKTRRAAAPALGALYIIVGKRLEVPVCASAMPGHFIAQFRAWDAEVFVDLCREGKIVSRRECQMMTLSRGLRWDGDYLKPVDSRALLCHTLSSLIYNYNRAKDARRATQLTRYLQILQG